MSLSALGMMSSDLHQDVSRLRHEESAQAPAKSDNIRSLCGSQSISRLSATAARAGRSDRACHLICCFQFIRPGCASFAREIAYGFDLDRLRELTPSGPLPTRMRHAASTSQCDSRDISHWTYYVLRLLSVGPDCECFGRDLIAHAPMALRVVVVVPEMVPTYIT